MDVARKSLKEFSKSDIEKAFRKTVVEVSVPPGSRLELLTPDRFEDVYNVVKDCFLQEEPLGKSLGLQWTQDFEGMWRDTFSHNLSIVLVNELNCDIMAMRAIQIATKGEQYDLDSLKDEGVKKMLSFFADSSDKFNVFDKYGVEEVFEFFGLGVAKKYRQQGIGAFLIDFAVKFITNLEVSPCFIKTTATSNHSKKIFEKSGFEFLADFPYDQYKVNGEIVFNNTGEHKSMKMYIMKL